MFKGKVIVIIENCSPTSSSCNLSTSLGTTTILSLKELFYYNYGYRDSNSSLQTPFVLSVMAWSPSPFHAPQRNTQWKIPKHFNIAPTPITNLNVNAARTTQVHNFHYTTSTQLSNKHHLYVNQSCKYRLVMVMLTLLPKVNQARLGYYY